MGLKLKLIGHCRIDLRKSESKSVIGIMRMFSDSGKESMTSSEIYDYLIRRKVSQQQSIKIALLYLCLAKYLRMKQKVPKKGRLARIFFVTKKGKVLIDKKFKKARVASN